MNNKLKKELCRFIIAGCCAVGIDCLFYYILSHYINLSIAKGISFLIGTIVAYLINKYYTFEQKRKSKSEIAKFFCLYISTLIANVSVNKISLIVLPLIFKYISFLDNFEIIKLFAFVCATGTSTILNFIGQKYWVFIHKEGMDNAMRK